LSVEGYDVNINGSTYSKDFVCTSHSIRITEKCSSFSTFITSPEIDVGEFENLTVPVDMPHFDARLTEDAIVFDSSYFEDGVREIPMPGQEGILLRYEASENRFDIVSN